MTGKASLTLTEHVACSPDRVWDALTQPSLMAKWWAGGDIQPLVHHRFTLDMGGFGKQQCEVLAVEPGVRLSSTFGEGFIDTVITWTLEPEDDGTRLTLEHAGFDTDSPSGAMALKGMGGGWPAVLARIEPALTPGTDSPGGAPARA